MISALCPINMAESIPKLKIFQLPWQSVCFGDLWGSCGIAWGGHGQAGPSAARLDIGCRQGVARDSVRVLAVCKC